MITYLLEQFASLPLSEREMVYCYDQFKTIKEVIKKSEILIVKLSSKNEYEVKPVDLKIDENILSYYLIGYSRLKGSESDFESYPLKLSRIKECKSKHKDAQLSHTEIKILKEIDEKFGSAYIAKNLEKKHHCTCADTSVLIQVVRETAFYDLRQKTAAYSRKYNESGHQHYFCGIQVFLVDGI